MSSGICSNILTDKEGGKEQARVIMFKGTFRLHPAINSQCIEPFPSKIQCHIENPNLPKTFSHMSHTTRWLLVGASIGIAYSQINHLTFLQHHKIYTFAPA